MAQRQPLTAAGIYLRSLFPLALLAVHLLGYFDTCRQFPLTAGFLVPVLFAGFAALWGLQIHRQPASVPPSRRRAQMTVFLLLTALHSALALLLAQRICGN